MGIFDDKSDEEDIKSEESSIAKKTYKSKK